LTMAIGLTGKTATIMVFDSVRVSVAKHVVKT